MTYIVDQLFPPVKHDEVDIEFSNFNYWRDPIPDLPELDTELVAPNKLDIATLRPIPEKWIIHNKNIHYLNIYLNNIPINNIVKSFLSSYIFHKKNGNVRFAH